VAGVAIVAAQHVVPTSRPIKPSKAGGKIMSITTADKRLTFRKMHEAGCFVLPNPFDVGSAKALQNLGFKALASTSAGFAWSIGKADNRVTLDEVCAHLTALCGAVDLPVNADFEGGFAHKPENVAVNSGVLLTGRCEGFLVGQSDLEMVIDRLRAYSDAGADCLYAPGIKTREQISAVVKAVAPKPVNLLIGASGLSVAEAADLGVRRISVGGSLARTAWAGFMRAAQEMAEQGAFTELAKGYPGGDLNKMFS
jgi:2-methylisocitrate lyase-like PEP mutase family enzyme